MQLVTAAKKEKTKKPSTFDIDVVRPEQVRQYEQWFQQQDKDGAGSLTAQQTWDFLTKSKLDKQTLKSICVMAVANPDAGVGMNEFCVGVHLTQAAVRKLPIPAELPAVLRTMLAPAAAAAAATAAAAAAATRPSAGRPAAAAAAAVPPADDARIQQQQQLQQQQVVQNRRTSEQLSTTEAMLSSEHDDTLLQKQELQEQAESMRTGNESQAARIKALEDTLHHEMHVIVSLREDLGAQAHRKADLEGKAERLKADLEKYRAEQREMEKVRSDARTQEQRLGDVVREMETQVATCEATRLELVQTKVELGKKQARLAECTHTIETTKAQTATVKRENEQIAQQIDQVQSEVANSGSTLASIAVELESTQAERADLASRHKDAVEQSRAVVDEVTARRQQVQADQEQVAAIKAEIEAMELESRSKSAHSRGLEGATRDLQGMIKQLKVELEWQDRYVKRLDEAIEAQRCGVFELQNEKPELEAAIAMAIAQKDRLELHRNHLIEERDGLNEKITSLKSHALSLDHDVATYKELIEKEQVLIDRNREWIEHNRSEVSAYEEEISHARQTLVALEEEETTISGQVVEDTAHLDQCREDLGSVNESIHTQRNALTGKQAERAKILSDLEMHRERIDMARTELNRLEEQSTTDSFSIAELEPDLFASTHSGDLPKLASRETVVRREFQQPAAYEQTTPIVHQPADVDPFGATDAVGNSGVIASGFDAVPADHQGDDQFASAGADAADPFGGSSSPATVAAPASSVAASGFNGAAGFDEALAEDEDDPFVSAIADANMATGDPFGGSIASLPPVTAPVASAFDVASGFDDVASFHEAPADQDDDPFASAGADAADPFGSTVPAPVASGFDAAPAAEDDDPFASAGADAADPFGGSSSPATVAAPASGVDASGFDGAAGFDEALAEEEDDPFASAGASASDDPFGGSSSEIFAAPASSVGSSFNADAGFDEAPAVQGDDPFASAGGGTSDDPFASAGGGASDDPFASAAPTAFVDDDDSADDDPFAVPPGGHKPAIGLVVPDGASPFEVNQQIGDDASLAFPVVLHCHAESGVYLTDRDDTKVRPMPNAICKLLPRSHAWC